MNESTTQPLDSASRGVVTGGVIKEVRECVPVRTVPLQSSTNPTTHKQSAEPNGRVTLTAEVLARPASDGVVANRVGRCTRSRHG
jgi:hypothetical protein